MKVMKVVLQIQYTVLVLDTQPNSMITEVKLGEASQILHMTEKPHTHSIVEVGEGEWVQLLSHLHA